MVSTPPRVIVSYFFGEHTIPLGASCLRAFKRLGCPVSAFDSAQGGWPERWLLKPAKRICRAVGLRHIDPSRNSPWSNARLRERALETLVASFRPDMLLVIRGHGFRYEYLQRLKERYDIAKLVGWWVKGPIWPDVMHGDARAFDHYFCIHREGYTEKDRISPLPALAVDSTFYHPLFSTPSRSRGIVFVGYWNEKRQEALTSLCDLPLEIYGPKWKRMNLFRPLSTRICARGVWGEALNRLYNETKIVLNITSWDASRLTGLNLRLFDVPASGSFLLTEHSEEVAQYFRPGEEIETFHDNTELRDKVTYYLTHDSERERIARRGYERACQLENHESKMRWMLSQVFS